MAKGLDLYLTEPELMAVIDSCTEWYSMMMSGKDIGSIEYHSSTASHRMKNGLGSALRKLYKGRAGEELYQNYKTTRSIF